MEQDWRGWHAFVWHQTFIQLNVFTQSSVTLCKPACTLITSLSMKLTALLTPVFFPQWWYRYFCVRYHQRKRNRFGWQVVAWWPDSVNQWGRCSCSSTGTCPETSAGQTHSCPHLQIHNIIDWSSFYLPVSLHICCFALKNCSGEVYLEVARFKAGLQYSQQSQVNKVLTED